MANEAPDSRLPGSPNPSHSASHENRPPDAGEPSGLLREALVLQLKLILEGLKDVLLGPISIGAAILDWIFHRSMEPHFFHTVLRGGERFERFLDLYGSLPEHAGAAQESRQGDQTVDTLLGWGEQHVRERMARRHSAGSSRELPGEGERPSPEEPPGDPQAGSERDERS